MYIFCLPVILVLLQPVMGGRIELNPCDPNPCQNGGTCNNFVEAYSCTCPTSYTGTNCETSLGGDESESGTDDGLSDGEIAGIAVGCVVFVIIVVIICVCCICVCKCKCYKSKTAVV